MTIRPSLVPLAAGALALAGCRRPADPPAAQLPAPVAPVAPAPQARWAQTWLQVESLLSESRFGAADSVLVAYTRVSEPMAGARAQLWRVLLRLEPRTTGGDVQPAITLLDSLLADTTLRELRAEGLLLRRGLAATDSLRRVDQRRRATAVQQAADRSDELRVTRDSLARLGAELQRLKARLRSP